MNNNKKATPKQSKNVIYLIISAVLVVGMLLSTALTLTSCKKEDDVTNTVGTGACKLLNTRDTTGRDLKYVKMSVKDYGTIIILLDKTTAPVTVENFLKLTSEGFYDGLTFHRIMNNFMIQGGDPSGDGTGGSAETIKGEFLYNGYWNDISHVRGVISMARSSVSFDSASSQFFICNADSTGLDYQYAAFGYVIAGMSVVDSITSTTVVYADSESGTIEDKSKHAVIKSVVEITEEEALSYIK